MGTKETVILGQKVNRDKVQRAKELRRKMTPQEQKLWEQLRNNRLGGYHFRRQQVIGGFIVAFYCNPVKLIIEVDGKIHEAIQEYDRERTIVLQSKGFNIIRITNDEIENELDEVLKRILVKCLEK
jgi:very-short-patch-repair endonuclease